MKSELSLEQFGIASLIPGFQRALDLLQAELNSLRAKLSLPEQKRSSTKFQIAMQKRSKNEKWRSKAVTSQKSYWAKMTKEERSAEMKRRMALSKRRKANAA